MRRRSGLASVRKIAVRSPLAWPAGSGGVTDTTTAYQQNFLQKILQNRRLNATA